MGKVRRPRPGKPRNPNHTTTRPHDHTIQCATELTHRTTPICFRLSRFQSAQQNDIGLMFDRSIGPMLKEYGLDLEDRTQNPSRTYAVGPAQVPLGGMPSINDTDKYVQDYKGRIFKSAAEYVDTRLARAKRNPDMTESEFAEIKTFVHDLR